MKVLYTAKIRYVPRADAWYHEVSIESNAPMLMSSIDYANIDYSEMIKDYIYERKLQEQYSVLAQAVDIVRIDPTTLVFVMQHRTTSHIIADHEARQLLKRAVTH